MKMNSLKIAQKRVKKCDHLEDLILCLSLCTNGIVFNRVKKTHCIYRYNICEDKCWPKTSDYLENTTVHHLHFTSCSIQRSSRCPTTAVPTWRASSSPTTASCPGPQRRWRRLAAIVGVEYQSAPCKVNVRLQAWSTKPLSAVWRGE